MHALFQLCLGQVTHRRLRPARHAFTYPVFYVRLPLRQLDAGTCAVFSVDRPNLLSLYSKDHGPRDGSALLPWIEGMLAAHGLPGDGEIVLQTFPRVLGMVFNPVSFWYCHDRDGQLVAILAEVNNTFGQTHSYLLHEHGAPLRENTDLRFEKRFHVSPFNRVEGAYRFRFRLRGGFQQVRIDYDDQHGPLLLTAVSGSPQPWSVRTLMAAFRRQPLLALGVVARIHWQALRLWCKRVPFHGPRPDHPSFPRT